MSRAYARVASSTSKPISLAIQPPDRVKSRRMGPEFHKGDLVQVIDPKSDAHGKTGIVTSKVREGHGHFDCFMVRFPDLPETDHLFSGADLAGVSR